MSVTLGLDVSPLRIGWSIHGDDTLMDYGVLLFDSGDWVTPGMRAAKMEDAFGEATDITHIGLEAVFVGPNKLGSIRAAMALGQIESICDYLWDAKQKILTAAQWRSTCGIQQGGKYPVMEWAQQQCEHHGLPIVENQDAADAIAIGNAARIWFAEHD